MTKITRGEGVLTPGQLQAIRLNELEHRHLRQSLDLMHEDFKIHLERLQRQAQDLKSHYTNVVRVVKSDSKYNQWKREHAEEMAEYRSKTMNVSNVLLFSDEKLDMASILTYHLHRHDHSI